jgi:hypothetical protein
VEDQSVGQTALSREESLSAAKALIEFIRTTREEGNITSIEPSTIKELMCYLIPLATSNSNANTLENVCAAAIKYYEEKSFESFYEHIKKIIAIGENL